MWEILDNEKYSKYFLQEVPSMGYYSLSTDNLTEWVPGHWNGLLTTWFPLMDFDSIGIV